jgi:hypothetical protein
LTPTGRRPKPKSIALDDGLRQASFGEDGAILVDQRGNPIFYTINLNHEYADFIHDNHIDDIPRLLTQPIEDQDNGAIPADLEFRSGSLELKSSWMIIEGQVSDYSNYIVARARVPIFVNTTDPSTGRSRVVVDASKPPREVDVAMLGLHVVGVVDGHPEFIWATFEHADAEGRRDVAPAAAANLDPDSSAAQPITDANRTYALFHAGASADKADEILEQLIRADQKFNSPTPVYRMFPGSQDKKPDDGEVASPWEDPAVFNLNASVGALFDQRDPGGTDWRRNYRLVGAVWIDQPRGIAPAANAQHTPLVGEDGTETLVAADGKVNGGIGATIVRNFDTGLTFEPNDPRLAGENRLSNMSLESFTQPQDMAPHCFSCHNTAVEDAGLNGKTLWARRINVSHAISTAVKAYLTHIQASSNVASLNCGDCGVSNREPRRETNHPPTPPRRPTLLLRPSRLRPAAPSPTEVKIANADAAPAVAPVSIDAGASGHGPSGHGAR